MSTEKEHNTIHHGNKLWVMVLGGLDADEIRNKLVEAGVNEDVLVVERGSLSDLWKNPDIVFCHDVIRDNSYSYKGIPSSFIYPETTAQLVAEIEEGLKARSEWFLQCGRSRSFNAVAECRLPISVLSHAGFQCFLSECARSHTRVTHVGVVSADWSSHRFDCKSLVVDITTKVPTESFKMRKYQESDGIESYVDVSGRVTFVSPVLKAVFVLGEETTKTITHVVVAEHMAPGMPDTRYALPHINKNCRAIVQNIRPLFENNLLEDLHSLYGIRASYDTKILSVRAETVVNYGVNRFVYLVRMVVPEISFSASPHDCGMTLRLMALTEAMRRLPPEEAGLLYAAMNM